MPEVIIKDNVILGVKSLTLKEQILEKGESYLGIDAQELK